MAVIKVPTSFNIDVEFEIPEFYRRLVALLIDILVQYFYLKIAIEIFRSIAMGRNFMDNDMGYNLQAIGLILFLPLLIYHVVLEITMNGQSVGKKIMNLRVVNENGGRASISQFLIRWLLRDIWFLFLLGIGLQGAGRSAESVFIILAVLAYFIVEVALVISSKKGQRIGDILAKTILIRTNRQSSIEETVFQEVADTYTPSFPQIMRLSDRDINAIKTILETSRKKGDMDMAAAASEKIKAHLKIDSQLSPFEFLDILLKDYNYLSIK
ncbi:MULTISPECIES: RDD family protein [Terrimonas]|uniref:RDD family protein n=1 Tax=Terrimonas TaxID=296051 RepID=UPI0023ED0603|nr:RDD family protein [Terrimonas sp. H1YJ31]